MLFHINKYKHNPLKTSEWPLWGLKDLGHVGVALTSAYVSDATLCSNLSSVRDQNAFSEVALRFKIKHKSLLGTIFQREYSIQNSVQNLSLIILHINTQQ